MPPWFIEKNVGIQYSRDDISLSEEEIATLAAWVDAGAPRCNPADMPEPLRFASAAEWSIGEPDLIVDTSSITLAGDAPDSWGTLDPVPTGQTVDRHVEALQIKEVSDVQGGNWWPVHEVGRNADYFEPQAGRLLKAGDQVFFNSVHMHANGEDTSAHLRIGFKFHPRDYQPERQLGGLTFGSGEIDLRAMTAGQEVHFYTTRRHHTKLSTFEPHIHATGVRMCLEAVWGGRAETLSCAGYDHNWVKVYKYADQAAPLLPRGTLLHVTATFDNTPTNRNVVDPRNWSGLGHRSIDNMAILIAPALRLTDEHFEEDMALRREQLNLAKADTVFGCPLCGFDELPPSPRRATGGQ